MTDLRPCPFCGAKGVELSIGRFSNYGYKKGILGWFCGYTKVEGHYFIPGCSGCGAEINSEFETYDEAIEKWNTRHDNGI